jgi:hypothetical protein
VIKAAIVLAVALAVIAPWTLRNYLVLNAFVPVSSNGGSVFYRSNNPLADGSFKERGERDIDALRGDEVRWNRTGFRWGLEWIRADPSGFVALIPQKMALFVGTDAISIRALERADREAGLRYKALRLLGEGWWSLVLILILVATFRCRSALVADPSWGFLIGTLLYVAAVHAVFESQARHHQPLYGVLAAIASMALWRSHGDGGARAPQ